MTAKPETAAEVRKPAGVIETHHDNAETEWGYSFTSHNPDPADYVRCYSEADAWKLADSLERALSAQGEAVAGWIKTDNWRQTIEFTNLSHVRDAWVADSRVIVHPVYTHPAPARVTWEMVDRAVFAFDLTKSPGEAMRAALTAALEADHAPE